jgi:hypothetical protein
MLLYVAKFDIRWKRCKHRCIDVTIGTKEPIVKSLRWKEIITK